jgi:hypothetical protein
MQPDVSIPFSTETGRYLASMSARNRLARGVPPVGPGVGQAQKTDASGERRRAAHVGLRLVEP